MIGGGVELCKAINNSLGAMTCGTTGIYKITNFSCGMFS